jgi:hypothetical protein
MDFGEVAGGVLGGVGGLGIVDALEGGDPFADAMGLIPGVSAGKNAQAAYQAQLQALMGKIEKEWQLPAYDKTPLTPQEYKLLATYAPQVAAYVQQAQPELLRNVQGPGQQAQQQSLNQLSQLANSGTDAGTKAAYELANMNADQAMRSNRANALALLASRGLGSSGATLGADIEAGMGAAEQQRKASLQEAADASQRKAQAIQALGNLGSQVAAQDTQKQEFNANALNQYNELLANRRQQYNQYAAETQNQAQMYNQQMAQQTANQNTGLNNQYGMYNQQRADQIANNLANSNNQRLMTEAGLGQGGASEALKYGMQQSQNETGMFMGLVGLGAQAGMMGMGRGAPEAQGSEYVASAPSSNYNLGGGGGGGYGGYNSGYSPIY